MSDIGPFNLAKTYVQLTPDLGVKKLPVDPDFWKEIKNRKELHEGQIITFFRFKEPWAKWEMHPAGDEIVFLMSGALDLLLEMDGGVKKVTLEPGEYAVIPRGVWHTGDVQEPSDVVHLTPGAGTEHRAR